MEEAYLDTVYSNGTHLIRLITIYKLLFWGGEKLNVSGDIVLGNSSDARIRYSDGVSRAHIAPDQNVEIRFGFANTSDKIFYHSTTEVAKINSSGIIKRQMFTSRL